MKIFRKIATYLFFLSVGFGFGTYKGLWFYHNHLDEPEVVNHNSSTTNIEKIKTKGKGNTPEIGIESTPTQNNEVIVSKPKRKTKKGKIGRK